MGLILFRDNSEESLKTLANLATKIIPSIQIQTCLTNFNFLVSAIRFYIKGKH